jgi:hypothetical protein
VDPAAGNDGAISTAPPPSPVTSKCARTPEQTADRFTAAWLGGRGMTGEEWLGTLRPLSTETLAEKLAGVDPVEVPAERVVGPLPPTATASFVEVLVRSTPAGSGWNWSPRRTVAGDADWERA